MTAKRKCSAEVTLVAIDVAKAWNTVLVEEPDGRRQRFRVANTRTDHDRLMLFLKNQGGQCRVALEPTGNYHRPLAHRLLSEGFEVYLVSSVVAARFWSLPASPSSLVASLSPCSTDPKARRPP